MGTIADHVAHDNIRTIRLEGLGVTGMKRVSGSCTRSIGLGKRTDTVVIVVHGRICHSNEWRSIDIPAIFRGWSNTPRNINQGDKPEFAVGLLEKDTVLILKIHIVQEENVRVKEGKGTWCCGTSHWNSGRRTDWNDVSEGNEAHN